MNKLTFKDKLGYGPAAFGDSLSYTLVCTFLLFFLTTVADLPPAAAGTIIAIGTAFDAVLNSFMGYVLDTVVTRWGRRTPFMFFFGVLLFFMTVMLFTAIHSIYIIKLIYYGALVMLFNLSYTAFFVPYLAMGADVTQDYSERATLRSYAALFNMIGSMAAMVVPTFLVARLTGAGLSTEHAWTLTAGTLALLSTISILITAIACRRFDTVHSQRIIEAPGMSLMGMLRQYLDVFRLKPIKWLLLTSLLFLTCYGMFISDLMYYLTYNLQMNSSHISIILLIRCMVGIAIIPLVNKVCAMTDKRTALIWFQVVCAVIIAAAKFADVDAGWKLYIFIIFLGSATVTYWQLMPAIIYDVCEYDELYTGQRRQGTIVSIQGLVESASEGIGTMLLGYILQFAGFNGDAAVQTAHAMEWIENCTTFVPAAFLFLSSVALYKYPITRQVYEDICQQLAEKKRPE